VGEREPNRERHTVDNDIGAHPDFLVNFSAGAAQSLPICDESHFGNYSRWNTVGGFVPSLFYGTCLFLAPFAVFLIHICLQVNAEETLKMMVPYLCASIMQGTESEEIIKEPHLNNELLYQLQILAEVI
jgi:hypothetical protein